MTVAIDLDQKIGDKMLAHVAAPPKMRLWFGSGCSCPFHIAFTP
jgi:hypothetical protein